LLLLLMIGGLAIISIELLVWNIWKKREKKQKKGRATFSIGRNTLLTCRRRLMHYVIS
jgi:competence protein ComGC